jgi:hypothetical protein
MHLIKNDPLATVDLDESKPEHLARVIKQHRKAQRWQVANELMPNVWQYGGETRNMVPAGIVSQGNKIVLANGIDDDITVHGGPCINGLAMSPLELLRSVRCRTQVGLAQHLSPTEVARRLRPKKLAASGLLP